VQAVRALRYDCDGDALLALVEPAGPACHTGERTCFHRGELEPAAFEALPALERTVASRHRERPPGSYTTELFDEPFRIGEKVEEEALEVVHAHREETPERLAEESADLLYHLLVLMRDYGVELQEVEGILNGRRG
jgi:phosphoribosyl-ATP pyrophosphohydrolase/phosphoribosyl-AMP cyclohydrolase